MTQPLQLYIVERLEWGDDCGPALYDSFLGCAYSAAEARKLHPRGYVLNPDDADSVRAFEAQADWVRAADIERLLVTHIGTAASWCGQNTVLGMYRRQ